MRTFGSDVMLEVEDAVKVLDAMEVRCLYCAEPSVKWFVLAQASAVPHKMDTISRRRGATMETLSALVAVLPERVIEALKKFTQVMLVLKGHSRSVISIKMSHLWNT